MRKRGTNMEWGLFVFILILWVSLCLIKLFTFGGFIVVLFVLWGLYSIYKGIRGIGKKKEVEVFRTKEELLKLLKEP